MSRAKDEQIIEVLNGIQDDINTLKTAQRIGGDSLLGYVSSSSSAFDYYFNIVVGTNKNFLITFTPTNTRFAAIVDLFFFFSGSPNVVANAVPPWAASVVNMSIQKLPPTTTSSQWYVTFQNSDGLGTPFDIYLKYIFSGTDTGTWTTVPV